MKSESWKEHLSHLSIDELKKVQVFVKELIQRLEGQTEGESFVKKKKETDGNLQNMTDATVKIPPKADIISAKNLPKSEKLHVVIFPPEGERPAGLEKRKEKRFKLLTNGVCTVVKREVNDLFADFWEEETPIIIEDISQHGLRFTSPKPFLPSTILKVKFSMSGVQGSQLLYKNIKKKIYVEVKRMIDIPVETGLQYGFGAQAIDQERISDILEERERRIQIKKQLAMKNEVKILIVYIKQTRSKQLESDLLGQGFYVNAVTQKAQAIAALRKTKYDIVISDMEVASGNNHELIKDIRDEFPEIGLFVEIETIEDWICLSSLGATDYLAKNFNKNELGIVIDDFREKELYKNMMGEYVNKLHRVVKNVLLVSGNDNLRKTLCDVATEKKLKMYFVSDLKYAISVIEKVCVEVLLVDTEYVGPEEYGFIKQVKERGSDAKVIAISKNLCERCDFLANGADEFIPFQIFTQGISEILI
ncbi:MAG: response regulator [Candidatus Brocadiaceae bacterium]|nr:response regulator [Candidatus Brocadiaceae bacterium]